MGPFFNLGRRADGNHLCLDGAHAESTAHHVGHGARRSAAGRFFRFGSPTLSDSLEGDDPHGNRRGTYGSAHAA